MRGVLVTPTRETRILLYLNDMRVPSCTTRDTVIDMRKIYIYMEVGGCIEVYSGIVIGFLL